MKYCENSDFISMLSCRFSKVDIVMVFEKEMEKLFSIFVEREIWFWNEYMSNIFERCSKLDNIV